jgi:hypothetical protein
VERRRCGRLIVLVGSVRNRIEAECEHEADEQCS